MAPVAERCTQAILKATVLAAKNPDVKHTAPGEQNLREGLNTLDPPHDPAALCHAFEHFNSLRQTVDAYATNIDGFGHRLECIIDFDAENADAEMAKSLRLEAVAEGEGLKAVYFKSLGDPRVIGRATGATYADVPLRCIWWDFEV